MSDLVLPDLVYPLKVAGDCDELKYSLRSLRHAEGLYGRVWVITRDPLPSWLTGVRVIRAGTPSGKPADVRRKIEAGCAHDEVSDRFLIMCDDFFLVEPVTEWAAFHMGPTSEYVARLRRQGAARGWLRGVTDTAEWMRSQGYGDVLARQGHRPLLWHKRNLFRACKRYPRNRQLDVNGLYDMAGAGPVGVRGMNSKIKTDAEFHAKIAARDIPWLSSNNTSFETGLIGAHIRALFPDPSPFERGA